jgi:CelD/BcsL family acetyltransferase involved in cellulose biosynthesis
MYTVRIATESDFKESKNPWNALVLSMSYPTVFCTWEWAHTWWKHFRGDQRLLPLFVFDGSELKGILPLVSRRAVLSRDRVVGTLLEYCGAPHVYPDHLDVIAAPEDGEACLDALFHFLAYGDVPWDVLRLPYIAEDSRLMAWLNAGREPLTKDLHPFSAAPYMPISGTFDDYLKGFSKKKRYNLLSAGRKLLEEQGVEYVSCDGGVVECLKVVFKLHEQRAGRKRMSSSFTGPRIFQFHADLLRAMGDQERVWLRLLRKHDKVIAAFYGFRLGGRLFFYQAGHDPTWEQHSPGTVLLGETIREAFATGCREFNFLQGDEDYKRRWTKLRRDLFELLFYRRSLTGIVSRVMIRSRSAAKRLLKGR